MSRFRPSSPEIVIIGAGIGGLAAAITLASHGLPVTVLEAQVYPGGCAATFYHQGFRFDAGATLAGGFYPGGPMDQLAKLANLPGWPATPAEDPAMLVHLPDGCQVPIAGGATRWDLRQAAFGAHALSFWRWQEAAADALWDLAMRNPPWPPGSLAEIGLAFNHATSWLAQPHPGWPALLDLAQAAFQPLASRIPPGHDRLRLVLDAQLLISAQATSARANALYGAAALDLPRRGIIHLEGGMGAIAETLVQALLKLGGQVHYRQDAVRILQHGGMPVGVQTRRGQDFTAGLVIANLPPANLAPLLDKQPLPPPADGWGAFVVYAGVDGQLIPPGAPLHHQVITSEPLGEGNSVFISISPAWDATRAPGTQRALTLSTHTRLAPWWELYNRDRQAYAAQKQVYTRRLMAAASSVFPEIQAAAQIILPGSPVTFERFTRRSRGWVGGFPQTTLFRAKRPHVMPGIWMVGDSIFPGQSVAAAALGGIRVARSVLAVME